jgi:tryptophan-rich sensory protein
LVTSWCGERSFGRRAVRRAEILSTIETVGMTTHDSRTRPPAVPAVVALLGFLVAVAIVAVVGGLASASASEQYAGFAQPSWAPPSWLFGPVWTVLYVMIAVSGWLVWRRGSTVDSARSVSAGLTAPAHVVYGVQLLLNMAWTPLFFGAGLFGVAFAEIVLLWVSIVATIVLFARQSRVAAWLLVPYLAWVTFASALNFSIWMLN